MSITPFEQSVLLIKQHKKSIDRSIRALEAEMEHQNTLVAETPNGLLQNVLKIYRGLKPLLAFVSTLPFLPLNWSSKLVMFMQALEALALVAPELTAQFKAGKDL